MTDDTHPAGGRRSVLVTGGTGKTGRPLTALLRARDVKVRVASRQARGPDGVGFDWSSADTYDRAVDGVDGIYLVQPTGVTDASAQVEAFLGRARAAGVRSVVLLSALGVDAAGEDVGFRKVERAVMGAGLAWTILRPNWFMQNFSTAFWLPTIRERGEIPAPAGDAAVSFIDARDIAAVGAAALTEPGHEGAEYTLTGSEALTFADVAGIIGQEIGRPVRHVDVSDDEMRRVVQVEGLPPDYAEALIALFAGIRAGWNAGVSGTVAEVTGRAPGSLAEYAKDHADAWRPAGARP